MHRAASSSQSVADRFNSYNTRLCSETDPLTLGPLLSGKYRLYHKPMSTVCSLYTLDDKTLMSGSANICLSFIFTMHFNHDSGLPPLQSITLCKCVWHQHLTRCHRSKKLKMVIYVVNHYQLRVQVSLTILPVPRSRIMLYYVFASH